MTPNAQRLGTLGTLRFVFWQTNLLRWLAVSFCAARVATGAESPAQQIPLNAPSPIDLATTLRLAGAQNLDIQIARQRLAEANANYQSTRLQFFPWLSPGIAYRRHDDQIQDVIGNLFEVHKQSYSPGAALGGQVDLGDAIYRSLAAKQFARAAAHSADAQEQNAILLASSGYFDLAFAQSAVGVAQEALRISTNYEAEIGEALTAGIAFKGDALRVRVQSERDRTSLRQAIEQHRIAGASLAQTLHLDPAVELAANDAELVPLTLIPTNQALGVLVEQALGARPELRQTAALTSAARKEMAGAVYGPLIPSVGAQAYFGGLGGGTGNSLGSFDDQQDYFVGLSWRIGPGGLFDPTRRAATQARLKSAQITGDKLHDVIAREVVEAFTRAQSLADQLETTRREVVAAEEGLQLTVTRKEYGVGLVLERIQAEQDLTHARLDHLRAVAEFSKAQFALRRAIGGENRLP